MTQFKCKICGRIGGHSLRFHIRDDHGYRDPELAMKQMEEIPEE